MFCASSIRETHRNAKELHTVWYNSSCKTGHVPIVKFSNWLRRVIWGRILRGCHHGTRLWNRVDVKWLWRILQSSGRPERAENDETIPLLSWHSSRGTFNQRCFAFIRPRTPLVYRYNVISRTQSHGAVFGCASLFDTWATSVLVGLNMYRASDTD